MKKFLISLLCTVFAFSNVGVVRAEDDIALETDEVIEEVTETETEEDNSTGTDAEEGEVEEAEEIPAEETEEEAEVTENDEPVDADEPVETDSALKGTQKAYILGDDWGPVVSKTIITFDEAVDGSSVAAEDFVVNETKDSYAGGLQTVARTVEAAYISDANGNRLSGWGAPSSSQNVTVEMYYSPNDGGAFFFNLTAFANDWYDTYELDVQLAEGAELTSGETVFTALDVEAAIDLSDPADRIIPQLDGVEIYGGSNAYVYTSGDTTVTVPYAYYQPAADGHKNPIFIWNHGAGERGTNPEIAILANEVSALWGSEFQSVMDNAYVIAPQVPLGSMTDTDRADAIVTLVKELAAKNPDIDLDRVYVAGCSMGGGMTVTLMKAHPDFFAAAVPICAAGTITEEDAEALVDLPTWFIHAEADGSVLFSSSEANKANMIAAGNDNVHSTFFETVDDLTGRYKNEDGSAYVYDGHWSWIYFDNNWCYDDADSTLNLWTWLAAQTKAEALAGTQVVEVIGEEWGAAVDATVLKLDAAVKAVSASDLTVIENNNGTVTERTVTDAYLSDENGNKVDGASEYVTVKLEIHPTYGNPIAWSMATWRNNWAETYRLYVTLKDGASLETEDGTTVNAINVDAAINVPDGNVVFPQLEGVVLEDYVASNNVDIPYALYSPNDGKKHGIILWNHGIGEGGTDPRIAILGNEVTGLWSDEIQAHFDGVYVLAAQVPDYNRGTTRADAIVELINKLAEEDPNIDLDRVYVMGCSAGGGMTTVLMKAYPAFFAAAVPICPAGTVNEEEAVALEEAELPIWYIHAENDDTVAIDNSYTSVEALQAAGSEVHTSYFADVHSNIYVDENGDPYQYSGHWSWVYAFNDECYDEDGINLYDWMAAQTRKDTRDEYTAGVEVADKVGFENSDAEHMATFTYVRSDDEAQIKSVTVTGNFQFFADELRPLWGTDAEIPCTDAYNYKKGMFNSGYNPISMSLIPYELTEVAKDVYQVTLPLPSTQYYYDFNVTYWTGETKTVQDPANPSGYNAFNGHDNGHSTFYVGDADATDIIAGQEEIFARDGENGKVEFRTYTAVDGTTQPIGIYTPYGYSVDKEYKVVYVSHGGGGNEYEWMYLGSAANIFDNLIAEGEVEPTIVVTLDHTYFGWNMDTIKDNLMNYVIPYMEANYSVSKEASGRAFCGLSMGGLTTTSVYSTNAGDFGYLGIWSATNGDLDVASVPNNDAAVIMLAAGCFDFGKGGYPGLMANMDAAGVEYDYYEFGGAHDWGVWRECLTVFGRDYLWETEDVVDPVDPKPTDPTKPSKPSKPGKGANTSDSTTLYWSFAGLISAAAAAMFLANKRRKAE